MSPQGGGVGRCGGRRRRTAPAAAVAAAATAATVVAVAALGGGSRSGVGVAAAAAAAAGAPPPPHPPPPVRVVLRASWRATPPAAEAAEWVASVGGDPAYWRYAAAMAAAPPAPPEPSGGTSGDGGNGSGGERCDGATAHRRALDGVAAALGGAGAAAGAATWALAARAMSPAVAAGAGAAAAVAAHLGRSPTDGSPFVVVWGEGEGGGLRAVDDPADLPGLLRSLASGGGGGGGGDAAGQSSVAAVGERCGTPPGLAPGTLAAALFTAAHDHVFPAPSGRGGCPPRVLLAADMGAPAWAAWHPPLAAAAQAGTITYAHRHYSAPCGEAPPALSGYAATASLRATEYSASDDGVVSLGALFPPPPLPPAGEAPTQWAALMRGALGYGASVSGDDAGDGGGGGGGGGARATRLLEDMPVRRHVDIPLAAAAAISAAADPLGALRDVAEDLPVTGPWLLAAADADSLADLVPAANAARAAAVAAGLTGRPSPMGPPPGAPEAVVLVNGRQLPAAAASSELVPTLRCVGGLAGAAELAAALQLPAAATRRLLRVRVAGVGDALRLDVEGVGVEEAGSGVAGGEQDPTTGGEGDTPVATDAGVIDWLNDLVKDKRYAAWRVASYTEFAEAVERVERRTQRQAAGSAAADGDDDDDDDDAQDENGMAPMGMIPVRKNMVRVVIAVDASDVRQLPYVGVADQLVRGMVPVRAGRVLVPTDRTGELVVASYNHLLQAGGPRVGAQFLGGVLQIVEYTRGAPLTADLIELVYGQVAAASGGRSGSPTYAATAAAAAAADAAPAGAGHVARARAWAARLGAVPGEAFPLLITVNGVPQPDFLSEAVGTIMREQAAFARLVRTGLITDKDSEAAAHAVLMRHGRGGAGSILVNRLPTALLPPDTSRMSRSSSSAEGDGDDADKPTTTAATVVAVDGNGTASVPFAGLVQDAAAMADLRSIRYVQAAPAAADAGTNGDPSPLALLTLWLVGDLGSPAGAATAAKMVAWGATPGGFTATRVRLALLHTGPPLVDDGPGADLPLSGLSPSAVARLTGVSHTPGGVAGVWANGRRLPAAAVADSTDLAALAAIERATRGDAVLAALTGGEGGGDGGNGDADTVSHCVAGTTEAPAANEVDYLPCADVVLLALGVVAAAEEACAGVSQTGASPSVVEALAPPTSPLWVSVSPQAGGDAAASSAVATGGDAVGIDTRWVAAGEPVESEANASSPGTALWDVLAVVDPTAPSGPAAAALLTALRDALRPRLRLLLLPTVGSWANDTRNTDDDASEDAARGEGEGQDDPPSPFAGRVFTKYLLPGVSAFAHETGERVPPAVVFRRLPSRRVLSLAVLPPRSWLVGVAAATRDLDNLLLAPAADGEPPVEVYTEYALESLLVEGSAADEMLSPPQGLRLRLDPMLPAADSEKEHGDDTLVMGNLGYFQLKSATPGAWRLSLAPAGGSGNTSAYSIVSIEGAGEGVGVVTGDGAVAVVVDSLDGARGTLLSVTRRADVEVPTTAGAAGGVRGKLKNLFGRVKRTSEAANANNAGLSAVAVDDAAAGEAEAEDRRIHVFSVASGHLYERLLKIMMLSVVRHARRPVKFWLLQNTLSPAFKALLPHFAAAHGFEVGLVTFRWPTWLRAQTDAQRTIWAYKILFLDVLFPLRLRRVIFVDSDQVVRSDLGELMDLPLDGAPYGYVPFCDSRRDVDGYRFWKTGYWAGILAGRPYHISALYVVDLDVFRASRTGDTLRAVYQSLSADPNSLFNLDQDLPNYAAVTPASGLPGGAPLVRIYSLPQEWLWCDSWCDQESKAAAKTIDLCNNPATKVPKLTAAKSIIPEWEAYDEAVAASTAAIYARLAQAVVGRESGGGHSVVGGEVAAPLDAVLADGAKGATGDEPPTVGGVDAPPPQVVGGVGSDSSHEEL